MLISDKDQKAIDMATRVIDGMLIASVSATLWLIQDIVWVYFYGF